MSIRPSKVVTTIDCLDARVLADFYAALLGWRVRVDDGDDHWADLLPPNGSGAALAFQTVANYRAPEWPNGQVPQQAHLDFYVDSLEDAGALALSLGARKHEVQPSEDGTFVVYLDPAGHPFCLCLS